MYWPTPNVAPNTFALSKRTGSYTYSHDGLDLTSTPSAGPHAADDSLKTSEPTISPSSGNLNLEHTSVDESDSDDTILAVQTSRGGNIFVTITRSSLTVWQTKPTVALASIIRSPESLKAYGPNAALLLRPDSLVVVLQTTTSHLITYTLVKDPNAFVYQTQLSTTNRHRRRESGSSYNAFRAGTRSGIEPGAGEGNGLAEVVLRFQMVIRIDAGISHALASDDELVVATRKPAALQTIRWVADGHGNQWSTELINKIPWIQQSGLGIIEMVHDRPMNLTCWIMNDGSTYAVQRHRSGKQSAEKQPSKLQYIGHCFQRPSVETQSAVKAAINARFSLIALGRVDGSIDVFIVKDYSGNIPFSYSLARPVSATTTGKLTALTYSPDGYCLFAGYERGWAMWSVYGKLGASSFHTDRLVPRKHADSWLYAGIKNVFWAGGGCELVVLFNEADSISVFDIARSATAGCLNSANVSHGLLQSSSALMLYAGHEVTDITSMASDVSLWQSISIPSSYLAHQWPIKASVVSPDGRYIAITGRRGLAHYSASSGRWKTFESNAAENEFSVRGGMCWWQHVLIAAVEIEGARRWQVRLYSREKALGSSTMLHVEELAAPVILISTSGTDSLLVYTHENVLLHYIIAASASAVKLVQVGQIGFHGIIRAPTRVRSISWILPDDQLEHGDPSRDVATAVVLFLVDAKLVLLQPSVNEQGSLKYDMRVIATDVEYYALLRDQPLTQAGLEHSRESDGSLSGEIPSRMTGHSLNDSLWFFDGRALQLWSDVQDVLSYAPSELGRDLPSTISIPLDFYPLGVMIKKGVVHGIEVEVLQRRDIDFSVFRHDTRTALFLPEVLQHHLNDFDQPTALYLSNAYSNLPYFAHALEMLLHNVLDAEVDNPPSPTETALLPTVVNFLSSFPCYLDIVVNCTRKTELSSWRTLFKHLPPVRHLFERSLADGKLKTAAGFLLVLHTFAHEALESPASPTRQSSEASLELQEFARLLSAAVACNDWEMCRELARFLVGIDSTCVLLQKTLAQADLGGSTLNGANGQDPDLSRRPSLATLLHGDSTMQSPFQHQPPPPRHHLEQSDYFSISPQRG